MRSLVLGMGGGDVGEALPVVSGSVRAQLPNGQSGTFGGGERATHRQWDKTLAAISNPWFEFFHGRILSNGTTGASIEVALSDAAACNYRAALLKGITGSAKNQSAATLIPCTFYGMLDDDAFVSAGGAVSGDGQTITVPPAWWFRSDGMATSFYALEPYMVQTECIAADGSVKNNPRGRYCRIDLGDLNVNVAAASGANWVFAKDWTAVTSSNGSAFGPIATLGTGQPGTKTVIVHGDSIICEAALPGTGTNNSDYGDASGAKAFAKRALNAIGQPYIDVSVSGTNIGNLMAGHDKTGLRARLMQYGDALITDHGHNDRRSGVVFDAVAGWSEGSPNTWNSTGLRTRFEWHMDWLRTKLRPGARIIACTLAPQTNSTDSWATTGNQTGKNDDSAWASDYATGSNGDQFKLGDLIMHRGLYSGLTYGAAGQPDAAFDLYAAFNGTADGKWPVTGAANYATSDGTHPSESLQIAAAATLAAALPSLLGGAPPPITPPAAPAAPTVAATSPSSVSATWSAPGDNGGAPVTSYNLRHSPDNLTWTTVTGAASPYFVTDLSPVSDRYVQVQAVNIAGAGEWSASGMATTQAAVFGWSYSGTYTEFEETISGTIYRGIRFLSSGTLTVTGVAQDIQRLPVAGGGPGNRNLGGGGGGGGVILDLTPYTLEPGTYPIVIGQGGPGKGVNGGVGTPGGNTTGLGLTAIGGAAGGSDNTDPAAGGCGAGAGGRATAVQPPGSAGTVGQGNTGGNGWGAATSSQRAGGGGGGTDEPGGNAANSLGGKGGDGRLINFDGTARRYGPGGGGYALNSPGQGGDDGGGDGGTAAVPGASGTGFGAGGGGDHRGTNGTTGSGSVGVYMIRWQLGGDGLEFNAPANSQYLPLMFRSF